MVSKTTTDLRAVRTRRWLQQALQDLMKEKSYQKIKISEIVARAEVARPTFYLHYESKDELLLSLFDELFAGFQEALRAELTRQNVDLHLFGMLLFEYGGKNAQSIQVLLDAGVEHLVQKRFAEVMQTLSEEVRAIDPINEKAATLMSYVDDFLAGGAFILLKRWIEDGMIVPSETLGMLMGEVVFALRKVVTE
ncbi:TetR/AcrR family transcriptional regulator [Chloroflexi bacterium TSY]|nr:TetR/AcrR family transcriptional regulator [Chloroflexi bacterium TSY]